MRPFHRDEFYNVSANKIVKILMNERRKQIDILFTFGFSSPFSPLQSLIDQLHSSKYQNYNYEKHTRKDE